LIHRFYLVFETAARANRSAKLVPTRATVFSFQFPVVTALIGSRDPEISE
jgi:hypothetical protein